METLFSRSLFQEKRFQDRCLRRILCLMTGSSRYVFKAGRQQGIPTGDIPTAPNLPNHYTYKFYIFLSGQVACKVLDLRPPIYLEH